MYASRFKYTDTTSSNSIYLHFTNFLSISYLYISANVLLFGTTFGCTPTSSNLFTNPICSNIKRIRTGDPNETDQTYWMFSYDFKSSNKDWEPENKELLKRKRTRNFLVFILYLIAFGIFLLLNSFTAHLLDFIVSPQFSYPI